MKSSREFEAGSQVSAESIIYRSFLKSFAIDHFQNRFLKIIESIVTCDCDS
jgi:hypothetical protein